MPGAEAPFATIVFISLSAAQSNLEADWADAGGEEVMRRCPVCLLDSIVGHSRRRKQAHDEHHDWIAIRRGVCLSCGETITFLPRFSSPHTNYSVIARSDAGSRHQRRAYGVCRVLGAPIPWCTLFRMAFRVTGPRFWEALTWFFALVFFASPVLSQSTEVMITGRVISQNGTPIPNARVQYRNYETGVMAWADTDARGNYSIPSLAPGIYALRAEGPGYQAREIQQREVYVAARLELNFTLRPLNEVLEKSASGTALLPDQSAILPVLGPDLELGRSAPLEATEAESEVRQPSLSYVIDPKQISQAPLSARNVYSLLVTLPGVTASQVSGRGLQISANGQRPSASNYLLDGVQNNDFVNTGPFTATAPEAIQEYRVSTNNYSAEYGQTGGFIANAVTRRGGNGYHGIGYGYIDNEALDSNTFWNNANSEGQDLFPRNAFKWDPLESTCRHASLSIL